MKPRAAWPVLVRKSKEAVEKAQSDVVKMRERLQALKANHERYHALLLEYQQRCLIEERTPQPIERARNFRAFIQQIQALLNRVRDDIQVAQDQLHTLQKILQQAEHKKLQMETLMAQDQARVAQFLRQKSQKEMDAAGIQGYQLRQRRAAA